MSNVTLCLGLESFSRISLLQLFFGGDSTELQVMKE